MRAYLVAELIDGHICWGAVLLHTSLLYLKIISSTQQFTRLNRSQASAIDSVKWAGARLFPGARLLSQQ